MGNTVTRANERRLAVETLERREVLSGVVTIGDSWAWLVAAGAPGSAPEAPSGFSNSLGTVMATFQPGVPVYNESFGGGTAAQMVDELYTPGGIIDRVNAHPDADVVWLSAGGNDLLLGLLGGGFYVNNPNNAAVFAAVQDNVQTIVDAILAERADLQVVIMGYDYLNIWDQVTGGTGDTLRSNLGVIKSGNTVLDAVQNEQVNAGFKAAEAGKSAIADSSRRVAHVDNFGLNNTYGGYSGYFGNFPAGTFYPPELYPALPTPPNRMNPGDAIHLNDLGYTTLALHAEQDFLLSAFSAADLALSTSTLAFGDVRIGTSDSQSTTASNAGANFTKVQDLEFAVATAPFGGGGQTPSPLFLDPTLGSDTATVGYTFAPTTHGPQTQSIAVSSDSGSSTVDLSGNGVGPEFSGPVDLPFDPLVSGETGTAELALANATGDGDLGSLTDLSLLSYSITGLDAARFSLVGFAPLAIAAGDTAELRFVFNANGAAPGEYTATFEITTDQGAGFGIAGESFQIALTAEVSPAITSVVGRHVFYNQSSFDGGTPGVDAQDDAAIAPDKVAYLPGTGPATFDNITSYSRGINGVMVDVSQPAGSLTADDFSFRVSSQLAANNTPSQWEVAENPTTVSVRPGAGVSGSDRVEIVWAPGAIANRWLQVIVEGNDDAGGFNTNTGLPASDIFFFGNRIGDTGTGTPGLAITSALDEIAARANVGFGAAITNPFDFDRSGLVNAVDGIIARNNVGALVKVDVGTPAAPVESSEPELAAAIAIPDPATPREPRRSFSAFDANSQSLPAEPQRLRHGQDRGILQDEALLSVLTDDDEQEAELVGALECLLDDWF
ncbi:MAG: choice-of-anchor D domain-containing protein [Planctomycetota bacterium]|nr:MAG: choice-of-anchor D domain-containing protein [Planctomycetota bacterium]